MKNWDYYRIVNEQTDNLAIEIIRRFAEAGITEMNYPESAHNRFADEKKYSKIYIDVRFPYRDYHFPSKLVKIQCTEGNSIKLDEMPVNDITSDSFDILETLEYMAWKKKLKDKKYRLKFENKNILITDPCYIIKKAPTLSYEEREKNFKKHQQSIPQKEDYDPSTKPYWEEKSKAQQIYEKCVADKEFHKMLLKYCSAPGSTRSTDWDKCECGKNMEIFGIKNYIMSNTIYGDWSCVTIDTDKNETIGNFCADAGLVGVFDLNEVLSYNPDFKTKLEESPHIATIIPNFTGKVWFELNMPEIPEDEKEEYKDCELEEELTVCGKGTVNFKTTQFGF